MLFVGADAVVGAIELASAVVVLTADVDGEEDDEDGAADDVGSEVYVFL